MNITEVILSIILLLICIIVIIIMSKDKILTAIVCILSICYSITFGMICNKANINPIEVYRGNTQLQITEKRVNGQIVEKDSIVILKDK